VRAAFAVGLCGVGLLLLAIRAVAAEPSPVPPNTTLAARVSSGPTAMEYWDVTAWLESGDRFFARFLVTNQGPGEQTAAAVGHLVLAGGEVVPFKWGRRHDAWTLGPGGGSLKIAKAALVLDGPALVVEVDSAKRGIELRLEIARTAPLLATRPLATGYGLDVAMPAPAHGRIRTRGMDAPRAVVGTGAVTHTWMERPEGEVLRRRIDLLAREGEVALYLSALTLADGTRRGTALVSRAGGILAHVDDVTFRFGSATTAGGDPGYPIATAWETESSTLAARVSVGRELLRMDPLDILPQPFRMLLALDGRPQRVWAEATADLALKIAGKDDATHMIETGILAATFARPMSGAEMDGGARIHFGRRRPSEHWTRSVQAHGAEMEMLYPRTSSMRVPSTR